MSQEHIRPEQLKVEQRRLFNRLVMGRTGSKCGNCGGEDRVRVRMIVPEEAGGQYTENNGVALCRGCDMAKDSIPGSKSGSHSFVVSIWMSKHLRERVQTMIDAQKVFRSWSSLTRYLIAKYVSDERSFDDLEQYQDSASDTKVTIRVDRQIYQTFHAMLRKRGTSVTDGIKGLFAIFVENAGKVGWS